MAMAYPGDLTIVPESDSTLTITLTYADGSGSSVIRIRVANDGATLTESLPGEGIRITFDRRF